MAFEAIDLTSVQARVAALDLFNSVSDVISAAAAMETSVRPPAAFVAISREQAQPNRSQGVHDQKVDVTVAVLICMAAERADQKRRDTAEDARLAVMDQLVAWTPDGARLPFDYDGYRVIRMGNGLIWTETSFRTSWTLRKVP